jgi:hypothetical protein
MKIIFYGNCQTFAIKQILNLNDTIDTIDTNHISCHNTKLNKDEFTDIIKDCDIIITQPLKDNYRDLDYLSTKYIINNTKKILKL